ncbi:hypothetical protein OU995_21200 [Roseateles sp. SL47]|uniref:hypothetical protein n=1 Tax=Roseateles sp. SL47 TaxID=2995138 RepID=UPI00227007F4|nr:hypothetical protein [Roseateles sp. SL47]WAC72063.1 hypothetical protein OU995_21200 [Roseateles sp. SL47]
MRRNGLSSLINGFLSTYQQANAIQRQEEDEKFRDEQRAQLRQQWSEADNLRASMKDAAAPAAVEQAFLKSDDQDNRDVGQPGEPPPTLSGFGVKGRTYASMSEAQSAADAYNAPDQVNTRMSQALMRAGKPAEAAQLRSSARQEQVAGLQLDEMQQAFAKRKFDDALSNMSSFDDIGAFTNTKAMPSADGKSMVFHAVGPDGTSRALPYSFANDAKGLTEAKAMLSKSLPTEQKLSYLHRQAQDVEGRNRWEQEFKLRQDSEARRAKHEDRMLAAVTARNASAAPAVPTFDDKLARETAHDAVKAENKRRGDANQALLSGPEVARMVDDYVGAQRTQFNNGLILQAASNDLSSLDPSSKEYAATYARALAHGDPKQLTERLSAMGFKPPAAARPVAERPSGAPMQTQQTSARPQVAAMAAAANGGGTVTASGDGPEAQALDAARSAKATAYQELLRWGSMQRAKNPQGFAAAQAAYEQARADEASAQQAWNQVAPSMVAAMRTR